MITSSGKQSDKELETSFVHLMQMPDVHVCHRDIVEFKISLPSSSLGALWPKPVKDITAVGGNVDQSKLDSQIDPYILCILVKYIHSRRQHKC